MTKTADLSDIERKTIQEFVDAFDKALAGAEAENLAGLAELLMSIFGTIIVLCKLCLHYDCRIPDLLGKIKAGYDYGKDEDDDW